MQQLFIIFEIQVNYDNVKGYVKRLNPLRKTIEKYKFFTIEQCEQ